MDRAPSISVPSLTVPSRVAAVTVTTARRAAGRTVAASAPTGQWRAAVQVGLVISIVAIVMSMALQTVVPTTPLVLGVMVVGFVASWIMTGRRAVTRSAR